MEILGAFLDEEWDSLSKMFENTDSLLQHYDSEIPFLTNSDDQNHVYLPSDHFSTNYNFCSFSQESSDQQQPFIPDHFSVTDNAFEPMNYYNNMDSSLMMMPVFSDDAMEEILGPKGENRPAEETGKEVHLKRKINHEDNHSQESSPKKIPRNARKNSRKNKKRIGEENDEDEGNNGGGKRQSSSGCSSEDDSNGKTKASRGSATDPQSLYARKRRERINERLKVLQNLVPNGTKVDISTMLEEAVQYVKFLQLQIKLLSSDDLWMYAPLAYNGMDISVYHNISPNLRIQN